MQLSRRDFVKGMGLAALAAGAGRFTAFAGAAETEKPMNVVFILADDLGWSDCTLYGHTSLYETPNLERLAERGMTFNRAYSSSPLCSPTRASIMTGQDNVRNGFTAPHGHLGDVRLEASLPDSGPPRNKALIVQTKSRLDTEYPTLGKLLKEHGYATGHFGKWHLGHAPYSPREHGFDVDIPNWPGPGPAGSFVAPWNYPDFEENYPQEHIEDRMAEEAVDWVRSLEDDQPYFMNYWQFSVHAPFDAKAELIDYYREKINRDEAQHSPTYAAMVHSLDDAVGTLLDKIDSTGMADRTAIIFISDNGGNMYNGIVETDADGEEFICTPTDNRPLRGGKGNMFEGGIRVPCVIVWPGVTEPGTRSDAMIQTTDLYPTLLNLLGIPLPENYPIDGKDLTPALRGEPWERDAMFTYFPHQTQVPDWLPPSISVHRGDWKLIRIFHFGEDGAHDYLLYNLKEDIGETNNLAAEHPDLVEELDALIEAHIQDCNAVVPKPNPNFDPEEFDPDAIGVQPGGLRVARRPHVSDNAMMGLDLPFDRIQVAQRSDG